MHLPRPALAVLLSLPLLLVAGGAAAQIRRCIAADGGHVYTDRKCEEIGASQRATRQPGVQSGGRLIRRDCSRRLQDLVFELTAAIDNRDVNRLAGIYHWPGTSARTAYSIMGRLDAIVNRPLIDITPLQPPPPLPTPVAPVADPLAWRPAATLDPAAPASTAVDDPQVPDAVHAEARRQQATRRAPTGLIVDQTVANRITPLQTVFSLRRNLGCWWISL